MTDTDGYFLPRPEQQQLRELLAQIPGLAEDLAIAVTRQDRIGRGGGGKRGRLDASPLPVNLAAMDARDELHACLVGWVRHTCEERQLDYRGQDTLIGVARWLTRWLIAVALSEGADEIIPDLTAAIRHCRRVVDIPPEDRVLDDPEKVAAANRSIVTRSTIDKVARRLGPLGAGLNERRMKTLEDRKKIRPTSIDPITRTRFYRLGDVLHAHNTHKPATSRLDKKSHLS